MIKEPPRLVENSDHSSLIGQNPRSIPGWIVSYQQCVNEVVSGKVLDRRSQGLIPEIREEM